MKPMPGLVENKAAFLLARADPADMVTFLYDKKITAFRVVCSRETGEAGT